MVVTGHYCSSNRQCFFHSGLLFPLSDCPQINLLKIWFLWRCSFPLFWGGGGGEGGAGISRVVLVAATSAGSELAVCFSCPYTETDVGQNWPNLQLVPV